MGASTMTGLPLRIIVGLGNPGPEHQVTRHNAGFWFVDVLAQRQGGEFRDYRKYSGETARISFSEQEIIILKPTTYMNRSGLSVRQVSEFYKIAPEEILVAHDELDLPVGSVRLKQGGGHGGTTVCATPSPTSARRFGGCDWGSATRETRRRSSTTY